MGSDTTNVRRGDIVLVEFDPTEGSEQRGTRPAVVIQNDAGNRSAPTTIVAPLTTDSGSGSTYPFEVEIPAATTPVKNDSLALLNQIRTVSIAHRIQANFGSLRGVGWIMDEIDTAIKYSLGL